jgi:3-dehydroquinate dehydratase-2
VNADGTPPVPPPPPGGGPPGDDPAEHDAPLPPVPEGSAPPPPPVPPPGAPAATPGIPPVGDDIVDTPAALSGSTPRVELPPPGAPADAAPTDTPDPDAAPGPDAAAGPDAVAARDPAPAADGAGAADAEPPTPAGDADESDVAAAADVVAADAGGPPAGAPAGAPPSPPSPPAGGPGDDPDGFDSTAGTGGDGHGADGDDLDDDFGSGAEAAVLVPLDTTGRPIVLLLSGPNLNLLGHREPSVYGTATLDEHVAGARKVAEDGGLALEHTQSNHEGDLVDAIHGARGRCAAIVINPGAFTHYAWGIHDALAAFGGPVVEVHLSNPGAREPWRHTSVVSPVATGTISGLGGNGYQLAVEAVRHLLAEA